MARSQRSSRVPATPLRPMRRPAVRFSIAQLNSPTRQSTTHDWRQHVSANAHTRTLKHKHARQGGRHESRSPSANSRTSALENARRAFPLRQPRCIRAGPSSAVQYSASNLPHRIRPATIQSARLQPARRHALRRRVAAIVRLPARRSGHSPCSWARAWAIRAITSSSLRSRVLADMAISGSNAASAIAVPRIVREWNTQRA